MHLDQIDRNILTELQIDARLSLTELARRVNLSKTPVAARVRALEAAGVIGGYRALISPLKLGLTHVIYMEIKLSDTRESALSAFNTAVREIPEVEECYMVAGGFAYLVKVRSRDMAHFRAILGEKLADLPHVQATSSYVSMEAVVEQARIKL